MKSCREHLFLCDGHMFGHVLSVLRRFHMAFFFLFFVGTSRFLFPCSKLATNSDALGFPMRRAALRAAAARVGRGREGGGLAARNRGKG